MRYGYFFLALAALLGFGTPAQAQYSIWKATPNGPGTITTGAASATDAAGNTYLIGEMCGGAHFGTRYLQAGGHVFNYGCGNGSSFLAKVDAAGQWQWATLLPMHPHRVAVDQSGHVFVAGNFWDSISVGPTTLISRGEADVFVGRLSAATGDWQWLAGAGGADYDYLTDLAVTPAGAPTVAGRYNSDSVTFGATLLTDPRPGPAGQSMFVAHLSTGGAWQSAVSAQSGTVDAGWYAPPAEPRLALDAVGDVYVTGANGAEPTRFGALTLPLGSNGYVARLRRATSTWQWATPLPRAAGTTVAVSNGQVYLTGLFADSAITLGTTTLLYATRQFDSTQNLAPANQLVAQLDAATGAWNWAVGNGRMQTAALAVDSTGALYLTGHLEGPAMVGTQALTGPLGPYPHTSLFVASLSAQGTGRWAAQDTVTNGSGSSGSGVGLDAVGNVFVGGYQDFQWSPFGPSPSTALVARITPGAVLGVAAESAAPAFDLVPNPATGTVRLTGAPVGGVLLLDALGRTVRTMVTRQPEVTLDLAGLPAGLYAVRAGEQTRRLVVE